MRKRLPHYHRAAQASRSQMLEHSNEICKKHSPSGRIGGSFKLDASISASRSRAAPINILPQGRRCVERTYRNQCGGSGSPHRISQPHTQGPKYRSPGSTRSICFCHVRWQEREQTPLRAPSAPGSQPSSVIPLGLRSADRLRMGTPVVNVIGNQAKRKLSRSLDALSPTHGSARHEPTGK